jgi:hypothetical protein
MVNRPTDYANEIEDLEQFVLTKAKKKGQKMDDKTYATKLATALKRELGLPDRVSHSIYEVGDAEDFIYAGLTPQDPGPEVEGWCAVVQKLPIPQSFQ